MEISGKLFVFTVLQIFAFRDEVAPSMKDL